MYVIYKRISKSKASDNTRFNVQIFIILPRINHNGNYEIFTYYTTKVDKSSRQYRFFFITQKQKIALRNLNCGQYIILWVKFFCKNCWLSTSARYKFCEFHDSNCVIFRPFRRKRLIVNNTITVFMDVCIIYHCLYDLNVHINYKHNDQTCIISNWHIIIVGSISKHPSCEPYFYYTITVWRISTQSYCSEFGSWIIIFWGLHTNTSYISIEKTTLLGHNKCVCETNN